MPLRIQRDLAARYADYLNIRLGPVLMLLVLLGLLIAAVAWRLSMAIEMAAA